MMSMYLIAVALVSFFCGIIYGWCRDYKALQVKEKGKFDRYVGDVDQLTDKDIEKSKGLYIYSTLKEFEEKNDCMVVSFSIKDGSIIVVSRKQLLNENPKHFINLHWFKNGCFFIINSYQENEDEI